MGWTSYQISLTLLLITTGSLNTITAKWADRLDSKASDGTVRPFEHPFVQTLIMFFGEMMCLVTFKILSIYYGGSVHERRMTKGNKDFRAAIFLIPSMCDMFATSIGYVGLTMTYASSSQMYRGSLIAFVALLSVAFLNRKIKSREWLGIFLVIFGLIIVGLSDFYLLTDIDSLKQSDNCFLGDLLIVLAQIIYAVQIVTEEYFVSGQDVPPLQAVGWEGVFGFVILGFLHIPMYFINVGRPFSSNSRGVIEDLPDAFIQITNNPLLVVALLGTATSIAFFNFASISLTKEISASTRVVLDSARTVVIWIVTVALGWQEFSPIQIGGFILLVIGMFVYNDLYVTGIFRYKMNNALRTYTNDRERLANIDEANTATI